MTPAARFLKDLLCLVADSDLRRELSRFSAFTSSAPMLEALQVSRYFFAAARNPGVSHAYSPFTYLSSQLRFLN